MITDGVRHALKGWFDEPGAYVLVDGQFGSTGKGLMAGVLAEVGAGKITHVTTNAGPNSGHVSYFGDEEIKLQQLPTAGVILNKLGHPAKVYLNAGAVIDAAILDAEMSKYCHGEYPVLVHPLSAQISHSNLLEDQKNVERMSSTGKGVGPAMISKLRREGHPLPPSMYLLTDMDNFWDWTNDVVLVETAQGFSLGINSAKFYPHVTSRECTVMQAIADARIPAQMVKKVVCCFRTYPIRVGSVGDGTSGGCYSDQEETTWEAIGVEPELTTVTKRVRRVFTWSRQQFKEAVAANQPDVIFLNFCNYLHEDSLSDFIDMVAEDYYLTLEKPMTILLGFGKKSEDVAWAK